MFVDINLLFAWGLDICALVQPVATTMDVCRPLRRRGDRALEGLKRCSSGRLSAWANSPEFAHLNSEYGIRLRFQYINTKLNPADAPSRLLPLDMDLVRNVMESAWGHREARIERRARGWQAATAVR